MPLQQSDGSSQPRRAGKHLQGVHSQIGGLVTLPNGKRIWNMVNEGWEYGEPPAMTAQVTEAWDG